MPDFVIKAREKKEYEQFTCRIETELLDQVIKCWKFKNNERDRGMNTKNGVLWITDYFKRRSLKLKRFK